MRNASANFVMNIAAIFMKDIARRWPKCREIYYYYRSSIFGSHRCGSWHRSLLIRQLRWAIRQHANDASIWKRIEEEQQKQREKSTVWRCCFVGVYLFVLRKKIKPSNATFLSLCGEKRKKARIHFRKGAIVADTYGCSLVELKRKLNYFKSS